MFNTYDLLSDFLEAVYNVTDLIIVGGNHDRGTSERELDHEAQIADCIFRILLKTHGHLINIEFTPFVHVEDFENIRIVTTHEIKNKEQAYQIYVDYGDTTKFTLIGAGHLHQRDILIDRKNVRVIRFPSLFAGNTWSESLKYNTSTGFLQMYIEDDLPKIMDCTI